VKGKRTLFREMLPNFWRHKKTILGIADTITIVCLGNKERSLEEQKANVVNTSSQSIL
jgi:hypothetical protein